jgi:microcystin-dependent protein
VEPFMAEVRIFATNYAPKAWALCNGQLLPINQNQALYSLLGTNFGGNGQTNFALPDMRGRVPVSCGGSFSVPGEAGGQAAHTLSIAEMPTHTHILLGSSEDGNLATTAGNLLAKSANQFYHPVDGNLTAVNPASVTSVGGSQAHENMMPYLVVSFCIALQGLFPTSN